ncbi:MAG: response regulator [Acidobacteria bacterium]|nr:response regulator [Acidobacteriota bacterium]
MRQAEQCLVGEAPAPWRLQGASLNDAAMLPVHHQANDLFGVCNVHLYSLVLCYWFSHHEEGLAHALEAEKYLATVAALLQVPVFYFYDSLNRIALAEKSPGDASAHLRKVASNQKKMKSWAGHAPRNHRQRYLLVEAERARIAGRPDARPLYRQAAAAARENEHPHEEGLVHELSARLWEARDEPEMVAVSLLKARELYVRWGAGAKVAALDLRLRPLLAAVPHALARTASPDSMTIQAATASLDLETVLKASQAISGEVVLGRLLETMIGILIENAGAERGLILLERGTGAESRLEIAAESTTGGSGLATSVVNYVARTGESVVLDDAVRDPRFEADPYLQARQPKSLLCLPIQSQGRLRGVIYLENNLTTGAFTTERVKTLSMLSGQIVISIGNAELVEGLEQKVEERTRSLRIEKERTEAALLEAEKHQRRAEDASRAKSIFLANMSHELRTPLNAVLGFAQLMARRRGRDAEDLEQLEIIGRAGEHLLGLINDVLSLSKIEAGQITMARAPFALAPMLEGLTDMLRVRAEGKGVDLAFEAEGALPAHVVGDESRLRQVILNLLSNAVKFTDRGRVVLRASWRDGRGLFEVEDTGPGMTPEELSRLFQPFVQTATGEKSKEGTGLGLSISRDFARLMGGDITVVSEPGKGSTFAAAIDLPLAAESEVVPASAGRRRVVGLLPSQAPFRILVVDDVAENRLLLEKLLRSVGLEAREAANGEEAVAIWREWQPHLIFMDLRMPVLDGRSATERIRTEERKTPERSRVRIVILSASAFPNELESMSEWGGDDFLAKPFREEALFEKVAELGVRFVYAAGDVPERVAPEGDVLTAVRLAALPRTLREPLAAALAGGDDEAARAAAEAVRAHDAPLADALDRAVRQYRFDDLLSLLEEMGSAR